MAYLGNSPGVASQRIVTTFTATAGQTTFTPSSGYALGYCDVFLNGVKLVNGDDYTAANGTTVVLASGASAGDSVEVVAFIPRGLSDGYLKAEADARFPRVDTASQGLNSTQQSNARTNIGAQAALGYTPVNKAGDTMTGPLSVSGPHSAGTPLLDLVASSGGAAAGTYLRGSRMLDPTMVSGQRIMYAVGRADSSKNMGQVYFGYQGDGSDSNYIALGLHSVDDALQIMGNGCLRTQYQPAFHAWLNSSSTTIPSGGIFPFNATVFNRGNYFNTSNGRFTAPVSGAYLFGGHIADDDALEFSGKIVSFYVNGNVYRDIVEGEGTSNTAHWETFGAVLAQLSAGDVVDIRMRAGSVTVNNGSDGYFYRNGFWGYLLG